MLAGHRAVLADGVARRLLLTQSISELGDFVGLSALLLLTYRRTGTVIGPAAVFAARALPSLAVGTLLSGWLDRPERRRALIILALVGGILISLVAAEPTLVVALLVAAALGATRTAATSLTTGTVVDTIAINKRAGYFALSSVVNQVSQVVGFLGGTAATLGFGTRVSLAFDAATFIAAAILLAGLPLIAAHRREGRPPPTEGIRILLAQPVLRRITPVVWASVCGTALPETIGPRVAHGAVLPFVMAAFPLGMSIAAMISTRSQILNNVHQQVRGAVVFAVAFAVGAVVLGTHADGWLLAAANLALGAASVWIVGARTTFALLTPAGRMAQVEATMVSGNMLFEGLGTLGLALVAAATEPAAAYLVMAGLIACFALPALRTRTESDKECLGS